MKNEKAEKQGPPTPEEEIYILKVALQEIGSAAVPGLIKMFNQEDWRLRAGAAHLLGEISPFPEAAVPAILHAMEDRHYVVRHTAGSAAERFFNPQPSIRQRGCCKCDCSPAAPPPSQEPFLNALIPRANDEHPVVRIMAVGLLGRLHAFAKPAVGLIKERLNDEDKNVRYYARQAFVQIDPEDAAKSGVSWP